MALREEIATAEPAALLRVARLVAGDAPLSAVFGEIAEQAAALLGVEAGAVVRFVGEERAVVVGVWRATGTRGLPVNAELDFNRANSALGRVRATRRSARVDSYEGARGELPLVMKAIGLLASVAAPVIHGGEAWGAIVASSERELPDGAEHRLDGLAGLASEALLSEQTRLADAAARRRIVEAGDAVRRRLEDELHEGAQQHVVALALKVRVARAQAPPELVPLLDEALQEAIETSNALGDLARALHPAVLSERGLTAALQALAARAAVPVLLRELPGRRFAPATERAAYVVVAEAIANSAAHAHATEVSVIAAQEGDRLVVEIRDDGIGGAAVRAGSGLEGLRDRVEALGGRLALDSPRGGGTRLRVDLPL